jgi:hypothetical protein
MKHMIGAFSVSLCLRGFLPRSHESFYINYIDTQYIEDTAIWVDDSFHCSQGMKIYTLLQLSTLNQMQRSIKESSIGAHAEDTLSKKILIDKPI